MSDASGVGNSRGPSQAPAGWYTVEGQQRYWDGSQWTDSVAPLENQPNKPHSPMGSGFGNQPNQQGAQQQQPFGQAQPGAQQPFGQPQQPAFGQNAGGVAPSASDDEGIATLVHLGAIIGVVIPLIIWLVKRDESQFVAQHALKALNFQIVVLGGYSAWAVFFIVNVFIGIPLLGVLLWLAVFLSSLVFCIVGAVAANKGDDYNYPVDPKLIK